MKNWRKVGLDEEWMKQSEGAIEKNEKEWMSEYIHTKNIMQNMKNREACYELPLAIVRAQLLMTDVYIFDLNWWKI